MNTPPLPRAAAAPLLALALAAAGCPDDGSCESSALCEAGTFCFEGRCVAALPAAASCTPPNSDYVLSNATLTTSAPTACNVDLPSTWPRPVAPSLPAGWVLPLSVDGVPDADFDTDPTVEATVGETVSFVLPPGSSSLTIHHQGVSAAAAFDLLYYGYAYEIPNSVVPTAIRSPSGGTVRADAFLDVLTGAGPRDPSYRSSSYLGITPWSGSFTLPQTSRVNDLALSGGELPAGAWSFQVHDWNAECAATSDCFPRTPAAGTYDVAVVARPGPYVSTGTLDVGIYLAGASAIPAASAVTNAGYQRFVWALGQVLGRAGICLGDVTFFDVPAWAPSTPSFEEYPPCSDLARLFSLASPTVDGVHLFLVDDFTPTGQGILGIDGSIPGPSGLPGSIHSGAAMVSGGIGFGTCPAGVLDIENCGSDEAGYIAAHEIGHWLGLYHTTESSGEQFDPLDDTPSCSCRDCDGGFCDPYGSTRMSPAGCTASATCAGGDNLMFWAYDPWVSRGRVTAEQGFVMRVNPAVK